MKESYFKTLSICMLISVTLLAASTFLKLPPWIALFGGAIPLSYYHLGFLAPRAKKGLSHAAIDSVYYFGFLVTISALGVSAVSVAMNGAADNLNTVVFQFGVGLFATGYAVVARMHLASLSSPLDAISPEAIMDRYIKRSLDMVDNVDTAVVRFSAFSETVMSKTTEVIDTANITAEKVMLDVANVFEKEMKLTLASARDGLIEIRTLISDTSFVAEREELALSMKSTLEVSKELNKALSEYAVRSRESAAITQESTSTIARLVSSLSMLNKNIDELCGDDGSILSSSKSLNHAASLISEGSAAIGTVVTAIRNIGDDVAATGPAFKSMRALAKKSADQLDALGGVAEKLDSALEKISATAVASGSLAEELSRVGAVLPSLARSADSLSERFERASDGTQVLERQLASFPEKFSGVDALSVSIETLGVQLRTALERASEGIVIATSSAQNLSNSNAVTAKTLEGANILFLQANSFGDTVNSLRQLLEEFVGAVQSSQTAISESSSGIKTAISSSTLALEADVKRSSEAAALLVERLVSVAEGVIARTQEQQRATA